MMKVSRKDTFKFVCHDCDEEIVFEQELATCGCDRFYLLVKNEREWIVCDVDPVFTLTVTD